MLREPTKRLAALGLVAFAASLIGCAQHAPALPRDLRTAIVTKQDIAQVRSAVASSTLTPPEKQRFTRFLTQNAKRSSTYLGKSVAQIIHLQEAHETGVRIVAESRRKEIALRNEMARIVHLRVHRIGDNEGFFLLTLDAHNRSAKAILRTRISLAIFLRVNGERVGLTEWTIDHPIPAHARLRFIQRIPFLHFAEDAGTMRLAAGRPRRVRVGIEHVRFAGGSQAGEDD